MKKLSVYPTRGGYIFMTDTTVFQSRRREKRFRDACRIDVDGAMVVVEVWMGGGRAGGGVGGVSRFCALNSRAIIVI